MKKNWVILVIFFAIGFNIIAQKNTGYFRGGVSALIVEKGNKDGVLLAFTVVPGFRIIQDKGFALTVSTPFSVGKNGIDFPLMAEFHFGVAAGNNERGRLGGLLGGGIAFIGYSYRDEYDIDDNVTIEFLGYRFHAGIAYGLPEEGALCLVAGFGRGFKSNGYIYSLGLQVAVWQYAWKDVFGKRK